jgi:hypothetical protein
MSRERVLIGWSELVDLPVWGVSRLPAKADTGARSSALHVENLQRLPGRRVAFEVVLHRVKRDRRVHVVAPISRIGRVRSSTGHYTLRYFVKTLLRLGPVEQEIEISLVDREQMVFRMLLGRTALSGTFVVDPAQRRMARRRPKKTRKEPR